MPHHDLVVIGTGSGNAVVDDSFADLDVAIVEEEQRFGGTCLNVGCIPSKMLAYAAEVVDTVTAAGTYGVRRGYFRLAGGALHQDRGVGGTRALVKCSVHTSAAIGDVVTRRRPAARRARFHRGRPRSHRSS